MDLEDFSVYQESMKMGEEIWDKVMKWDTFEKKTIGDQLVRVADSVAANLSEGLGRYHFKETKHFGYYSRGSLYGTQTWLTKAYNRQLVDKAFYDEISKVIKDIGVRLNNYIYLIGKNERNNVKEDDTDFFNYPTE